MNENKNEYSEYINGEINGENIEEAADILTSEAADTDEMVEAYAKIEQPYVKRTAVMDNVRLMDDSSSLLSGHRLDPDGEDIGFGENAIRTWNKPKPKRKKEKKHIFRWLLIACAIVAVAATTVLLLLNHIRRLNNAPAPVHPESFPTLYTTVSGDFDILSKGWDDSYTAVTYAMSPDQDMSEFIKTNNNGSVVFFPDSSAAAEGGQYNLFYRKTNDSELSEDDEIGTRIASNVMGSFAVSRNGKYVAYLKDAESGKGKLYVSNLYYETAIEERDVVSFRFSNDNKYIMYFKNSGEQYDTVYIKRLDDDSEKVRIDNNVIDIVSCSDDFERIYYLTLSDSQIEDKALDVTGQIDSPETSSLVDDGSSTPGIVEDANGASQPDDGTGSESSIYDDGISDGTSTVLQRRRNDVTIEQKSDISVALLDSGSVYGQSSSTPDYNTGDPYNDPTTNPYLDQPTDSNDEAGMDEWLNMYNGNVISENGYDTGETAEGADAVVYDSMENLDALDTMDAVCTFKLKIMSRDAITIVDGVTSVSDISAKGNFAFTMGSSTVLTFEDLVDDEYASTDMVIHEPTREEFTVTTDVPNAPTQNMDGSVIQNSNTVTTFDSDSYNRAMETYNEKARRDTVRNALKDQTVEIKNNILYCFVDGNIIKVSDDCDQYYALDIDSGTVAYVKRETESVKRYRLTDLLDDPNKVMNQTGKSDTLTLYCVAGNQIKELSRSFGYSTITQIEDRLYYLNDYDAKHQKGSLMRLEPDGTSVKMFDDVCDYRINAECDSIAYLTNLNDEGYGELYFKTAKSDERTKVSSTVKIGKFTLDNKGNCAAISGEDNTLVASLGTRIFTIAKNVSCFTFKGNTGIYIIKNSESSVGNTLSYFDGEDIEEIADEVGTLIWDYNERIYAD